MVDGQIFMRELSCQLSELALQHRLKNAFDGHRWVCDKCGNTEFVEREVSCWGCGSGEMIYKKAESLK